MRIAVDAMGGDLGPAPLVAGAVEAARALGPGLEIVLVGREDEVRSALAACPAAAAIGDRLRVEHAAEVVEMSEAPTTALRRKKGSSIRRVAELVASGEADGMVSAGSTGAVTATMMVVAGLLAGVDRPAIAAVLPTATGSTLLLDVGATVDCRAGWLVQFAVMGRCYSELVLGRTSPRVGLLSIGEEASKGNDLTREVHKLLEGSELGLVGNVEGKDIFSGRADVVVCDGFVGNVVLKASESIPALAFQVAREEVERSPLARLGVLLARGALRRVRARLDWESYGGAPLLGVDGACIICHGRSGPRAIGNAVRVAHDFVAGRVGERIAERLKGVH